MAVQPFLQLPDELLLEVLSHIPGVPRSKQQDMLNLSLTCKRFRSICVEALLVRPVLKLSHVAHLVHRYFLNPTYIPKVQALEIVSATSTTHQSQSMRTMLLAPGKAHIFSNHKFIDFCRNMINKCTSSSQKRSSWIQDLTDYSLDAYLGILLLMLPNLNTLLLGPNFLSHYPLCNPLICSRDYERNGITYALETPTSYLDNILHHLQQKLTILELPVLWNLSNKPYSPQNPDPRARNIQNHLAPISPQSLPHFTNLKELTLPCYAFGQHRAIRPMWDMSAKSTLPPNLEILRIVDAEHVSLRSFLRPVLRSATSLPSLKRVEVYFHDHLADAGCAGREERLQVNARAAGVDLYMRHPKLKVRGPMAAVRFRVEEASFDALDAWGQPWRYGKEELLQLEEQAWKRREAGGGMRMPVHGVPLQNEVETLRIAN